MGQCLLIMGALKMKVQSLMHVLLGNVSHAACLSFEVDHLFSGPSVLWDERVAACLLFLT